VADSGLPNRVLVIDDDPSVCQSLENTLLKHKITTLKASDLQTALYHFNQNRLEVVIVEVDFGPMPGLALVQKWRNHEMQDKRQTGFVMMQSGTQRSSGHDQLIKEMADLELISKPINPAQILSVLARAASARKRLLMFQNLKEKLVDPYIKQGKPELALEKLGGLVNEIGEKAKKLQVELYENLGRFSACLDMTLGYLKAEPSNIFYMNTAGRMCLKLGKLTEAKTLMEKADSLAPENIERMNQMAELFLKMEAPDKSVALFKKLVDLNADEPDFKFQAFGKLCDAGYDQKAIEFGQGVAQPQEVVKHFNNKGVLLAKEGQHAEALISYERAVMIYPKFKENYRIFYNMALAHLSAKPSPRIAEAEKFLLKTLELDPGFEKAKVALAALRNRVG
jgi:tetratricopeptide (TPR) repeat protein